MDTAFAISDDNEREAALRALRPVYHGRLSPQFHAVPWGDTLVERKEFRAAYAAAQKLTAGFSLADEKTIIKAIEANARTLMVFRLIIGYTTNELAEALELVGVEASKGMIDSIERGEGRLTDRRREVIAGAAKAITGVIAGELFALEEGLPPREFRSRLAKYDTQDGWESVKRAGSPAGTDYADVLYERYLDGPWLAVRSAYSEKKGKLIENAVASLLRSHGIPFDQNPEELVRRGVLPSKPDFVLPDVDGPLITIEAKGADDGGTARDKAARIANVAQSAEQAGMVPMAVIDGIGFRRRDALVQTLQATHGLTFSLSNLDLLILVPEVQALVGTARRTGPKTS